MLRTQEIGAKSTQGQDNPSGPAETLAPSVETGVLLIAARDREARATAEELRDRLAPARVVRAGTISEALAVGLGGIDCVVLDLESLDGDSGIDAVRQVRSGVSDYVPLVVLLGDGDEVTGRAAMQFGAQAYLDRSSLEPGQLSRTVRDVVRDHSLETAEHELSAAHASAREAARLERGLSPQPMVRDASLVVATVYEAGRRRALLGGDFIDLVQIDERRVRLLVGDVCGHGPDEAAVGVSLRGAWRALAIAATPLQQSVHTLESIFVQERHLPALFVTLCTVEVDRAERTAEVLVAGHPPPLLIDGDSVRLLANTSGRALGIAKGDWRTARVEVPAGWTILGYTDGLIEGRTGDGADRLGEDGVLGVIGEQMRRRESWSAQPRELLHDIVEAAEGLNQGPLIDDVAMLLVGERAR